MAEKNGGNAADKQGGSSTGRPQSYVTGLVQKGKVGGQRPKPYGTGKVQEGDRGK